ncbi:transposase [Trichodesmium erythraeum IMS101]|uniref:Transposase n=1 Tax=Trichodesmium erythraeum (strain IMS101) TaxID=203124 RepID=Q10ZK2_TRIEI|nr:transposase family protein [Trichodesmium erythraeum GBRTRLIN201]
MERTKSQKLIDIITIIISDVICGVDTWIDIKSYGKSKSEWLKSF